MGNLLDKLLLRETYDQIKVWVLAHKLLSTTLGVAGVALLIWGGLAIKNRPVPASYVLATVQKGTIMSTVTGTGQVSASHQIDLAAKASGKVTAVKVHAGQSVKAGALLVQLDSTDAQKAVRDARLSLTSAQLSLQKTQASMSQLSLIQAQDALTQAQQNQTQSQESLSRAYDDALATADGVLAALPGTLDTLKEVLFGQSYSPTQDNVDYYYDLIQRYSGLAAFYRDNTGNAYRTAQTAYNNSMNQYHDINTASNGDEVANLISDTYTTTKTILDALKTTSNYLSLVDSQVVNHSQVYPSNLAAHRSELTAAISQANSALDSIYGSKSNIENSRNAVTNAATSVAAKTESLKQASANTAQLDLKSAQLSVTQRRNALSDALETLANYSVKAPFDGVIAKVNVQPADTASGAVATIITSQSLVDIPLNEVDVAKVQLGDKATITFDAIADLSMTGSVAAVDYIGTVSQGVVTYSITLSFDTQDDRIKPGMSANATIITDVKQDVLMVPSGAVKLQGTAYYVEKLSQTYSEAEAAAGVTSATAPTRQAVEIGIADDTNTEITSGLSEGDQVVARTVTSKTAQATTSSTPNLFGTGASSRSSSGSIQSFGPGL